MVDRSDILVDFAEAKSEVYANNNSILYFKNTAVNSFLDDSFRFAKRHYVSK